MKIEQAINQKKFDNAYHKVYVNLIFTHNWFTDKVASVFKNLDITQQQYNVLRILRGAAPKALCMGEIKDVMLDKNPDLTRLCNRLVAKKYVERFFDEDNRRMVRVKITDEGLNLLQRADPILAKHMESFNFLSEEESEQLSDLLDKMRG